jgi:hypothetical protein
MVVSVAEFSEQRRIYQGGASGRHNDSSVSMLVKNVMCTNMLDGTQDPGIMPYFLAFVYGENRMNPA